MDLARKARMFPDNSLTAYWVLKLDSDCMYNFTLQLKKGCISHVAKCKPSFNTVQTRIK